MVLANGRIQGNRLKVVRRGCHRLLGAIGPNPFCTCEMLGCTGAKQSVGSAKALFESFVPLSQKTFCTLSKPLWAICLNRAFCQNHTIPMPAYFMQNRSESAWYFSFWKMTNQNHLQWGRSNLGDTAEWPKIGLLNRDLGSILKIILTTPTPHISKKYAPKICHKMGGRRA